jgi:G:T-mismatch repair DNA endonuclease (very short patch repair protein)
VRQGTPRAMRTFVFFCTSDRHNCNALSHGFTANQFWLSALSKTLTIEKVDVTEIGDM